MALKVKKLVYVGELTRTPDAFDHRGIKQGLEWLGIDYLVVDPVLLSPAEIINKCNNFGADLIVHGNTDSLDNGTIPEIKGKQVFFLGDCRTDDYPWDRWGQNKGYLDHVFISNRDQLKIWSEKFDCHASFWTHGCYVPDKLEYDKDFAHEVVFIGTHHDHYPYHVRRDFIKLIESKIPIRHITGSGVEGRNEIWRQMPKIYHSSKFVLDVSHFWDLKGYASGRYWYSAGLGGCALTKRFPDCEEFYKDKIHKLYFDSPEEAAFLYKHYSKYPDEIQRIKQSAYEWNKKYHNYKVRFKTMFKILNA